MKLYFYFLEDSYYTGVKPYIRLEECSVIEKPKTYKPVDEIPRDYYYCSVKKEDIGKISGSFGNAVVLLEKNNKVSQKQFEKFNSLLDANNYMEDRKNE